jgi:hypothetical protein
MRHRSPNLSLAAKPERGTANAIFNNDSSVQNINVTDPFLMFEQYNNIRYVLDALGVENRSASPHQHHFHISMAPPPAREIGNGQKLETIPRRTTLCSI